MKTDSLFYRLFQDWPELVLELAGLETLATGYTLRAEEVKQTGFRLDGVLAPPEDQPDWPLVFVETQFQHDPDFHARWFSALFLYLYRRPPRRAWRAVVLFPNRATEGPVEAAYKSCCWLILGSSGSIWKRRCGRPRRHGVCGCWD